MRKIIVSCLLSALLLGVHAQKKIELAESAPMGWNSWNYFGKKDINEQVVKETIDAMVENGLRDAGYVYVVIDGGWRDTKLGPNGELLAHPIRFPNGIKPLSDYAHSRGMRLGVHVVPGTHDCAGDPVGGWGREDLHVSQFVEWELDFIKLDACRMQEDPCVACVRKTGWSEKVLKDSYFLWSTLLYNCGRDIVFSISAYQYRDWYPEICNMARTTGDIQARIHKGGAMFNPPPDTKKTFFSVMEIAVSNNLSFEYGGEGYWNDPDMLVTGEQGLTELEQASHFALWCIMSAPLMLGNNPADMTEFEKRLVTNEEMIAVNQDTNGQGHIVKEDGSSQVWMKQLNSGEIAVLLLNLDREKEQFVDVSLKDLGIDSKVKIRDILAKQNLGKEKEKLSFNLKVNECKFLLLE